MLDWQNIIVVLLVALSAGYLISRGWQVLIKKQSPGCASGCGSCPANGEKSRFETSQTASNSQRVFVPLDVIKR